MKLVKATAADSHRLMEYFSQTTLPGPIQLRMNRPFDFFNQYKIQSDDFVTFMLVSEKTGEIGAMATLVFRQGFIGGRQEVVGYATDLRVSPSRKAVLQWAQYFLPAFQEELDKRKCKHVFSVVAESQRQAYNAFLRPRSPRRQMPRYFLYRRFNIVSLHGLIPFAPKPLPGITVRYAEPKDADALIEYLLQMKLKRHFCFDATKDQVEQGLKRWQDLSIENFLLALDSQGNMIGCTAPWSSQNIQRAYPLNMSARARSLQEGLMLLSLFGIGRRLFEKGQSLRYKHLTNLYANNPDIFYSLLYESYKRTSKSEFLVYPQFFGDILALAPRPFVSAKMKCGLYSILSPNEPPPELLKPTLANEPPDFELAFL